MGHNTLLTESSFKSRLHSSFGYFLNDEVHKVYDANTFMNFSMHLKHEVRRVYALCVKGVFVFAWMVSGICHIFDKRCSNIPSK